MGLKSIDLDQKRAARREAAGEPVTLTLSGKTVVLPVELPIDVFAPLQTINFDVAMLVRTAMQAYKGGEDQFDAAQLCVDLVVQNPDLPTEVIAALKEITRRLIGDEGYAALIEFRPSREDLGELAKGLIAHYGVGLGESSESSDSSTSDGETSSLTSSASTDSTPETSTDQPETPASSESAA